MAANAACILRIFLPAGTGHQQTPRASLEAAVQAQDRSRSNMRGREIRDRPLPNMWRKVTKTILKWSVLVIHTNPTLSRGEIPNPCMDRLGRNKHLLTAAAGVRGRGVQGWAEKGNGRGAAEKTPLLGRTGGVTSVLLPTAFSEVVKSGAMVTNND